MSKAIWQKNLLDAMHLDPLIVLHGNVKDLYALPYEMYSRLPENIPRPPYVNFDVWLALHFETLGYPVVILYDPVDGAVCLRGAMVERYQKLALRRQETPAAPPPTNTPVKSNPGLPKAQSTSEAGGQTTEWLCRLKTFQKPDEFFRTLYEQILPQTETPVAVVCRFMDRYLSFTDRQDQEERRLSLLIQKAALAIPRPLSSKQLSSRIALVFDSEGGVPQELNTLAPFAKSVRVPVPTLEERETFFRDNHAAFDQTTSEQIIDPTADTTALRLLANLSEGLRTQDLLSLAQLSQREQLGLAPNHFKELLDRFKFGTRENAWVKIKKETLSNARTTLTARVKGQDEVIAEVLPVLIRAKLGMTDLSSSQFSSKPRGVFFFVGPTGVGKTELSKAIAELIFGNEQALIRFDMSEYSEEHQQARLIGAPPGYVGFDQGGQLTNAVSERPFSVILFDEIEKAHGRILDKFLQILDDGRLTDGMGKTVYFSESILIFTSNLGTAPRRQVPSSRNIAAASNELSVADSSSMAERYAALAALNYEQLTNHFRGEVKDFFVNNLGRPEILNRIGEDNILVFRFLSNEDTKDEIVNHQIELLRNQLKQKFQVDFACTRSFRELLKTHPNGFSRNGARGVRNLLNRFVLNRLAVDCLESSEKYQGMKFKADYLVPFEEIATTPCDQARMKYEWLAS